MASEQPTTDHLIDLIYGELTQEEESSLRENVAQSTEMQAELVELDLLFQNVNDVVEVHDVPDSLHASIMAAAREAAADAVEDEARAVRIPPVAPGHESRGMWSRIRGSQFSQIAMVATVLLAGAFVFRFVSLDDAAGPGMIEMEERAAAPVVAEAAKEPIALADESSAGSEPPLAQPTGNMAKTDAPNKQWDPAAAAEAERKGAEKVEKPAEQPRPEVVARSTKSKTANKKRKSKKRTRTARAPSKKSAALPTADNSAFGGQNVAEPSPAPVSAKDSKSAPLEDDLAVGAFDSVKEEEQKREFKPKFGTLDAVQEAYNRRDYRETIKHADRVLAGGARLSDKARALELKAQAYNRMGMVSQADTAYRNLQNNYPEYNSASVRAARNEIARKLDQKRDQKKKRSAKPKKSYDFEAESAPTSLD